MVDVGLNHIEYGWLAFHILNGGPMELSFRSSMRWVL